MRVWIESVKLDVSVFIVSYMEIKLIEEDTGSRKKQICFFYQSCDRYFKELPEKFVIALHIYWR